MNAQPMTPLEAEQLLEADKRQRVEAMGKAIQAAAQEFHCDLLGVPQIAPDGRVVAVIQIVAR